MGSRARDLSEPTENAVERSDNRMSAPNEPNPLHVNRVLWILLGLSVLFLVSVQIYVGRVEKAGAVAGTELADFSILQTFGPVTPVRASSLWLSWGETVGVSHYELRIHSDRGVPVVDPMVVYGTEWRAPDEVLPGLTPGAYRWTVEAVAASGEKLATSGSRDFTIVR